MRPIWERIQQAFGRSRSRKAVRVPTEKVAPLVRSLQTTMERELGCQEADALMDSFAEALAAGATPESLERDFRHHLDLCADCREEFDALLRMLSAAAP